MRPIAFQVKRHGQKIENVGTRGSVATGITYNMYFEGLRACQWASANLERWMNGGYDKHFMATTIAMYRMDGLIEQHGQDAVGMAMKKRQKS